MPTTEVALDLAALEGDLNAVVCESQSLQCRQAPPHLADWYAVCPCGDVVALCEDRRRRMYQLGWWMCRGHTEEYDSVRWVPIVHR